MGDGTASILEVIATASVPSFTPPQERLAYAATLAGEVDFHGVLAEPLSMVTGGASSPRSMGPSPI